jgi:hypothetical protein
LPASDAPRSRLQGQGPRQRSSAAIGLVTARGVTYRKVDRGPGRRSCCSCAGYVQESQGGRQAHGSRLNAMSDIVDSGHALHPARRIVSDHPRQSHHRRYDLRPLGRRSRCGRPIQSQNEKSPSAAALLAYASRSRTRITCAACHLPPCGVATPRAMSVLPNPDRHATAA